MIFPMKNHISSVLNSVFSFNYFFYFAATFSLKCQKILYYMFIFIKKGIILIRVCYLKCFFHFSVGFFVYFLVFEKAQLMMKNHISSILTQFHHLITFSTLRQSLNLKFITSDRDMVWTSGFSPI